jgi:hypothetical protein
MKHMETMDYLVLVPPWRCEGLLINTMMTPTMTPKIPPICTSLDWGDSYAYNPVRAYWTIELVSW